MPRRRKQKLAAKFVARRLILALLSLAVVGFCVYFVINKLFPGGEDAPDARSQASSQSSGQEASSEPQSSGPEPESSSESSSEPESSPASEVSQVPVASEESREIPSSGAWSLILANPQNPLPKGYAPPELAAVSGDFRVDARIANALKRMLADAKADGISLVVCSAYRSEEYQQTLYTNKTQEFVDTGRDANAAAAAAATIVAKPGTSEHQTGLALDIVSSDYRELDEGYAATPAAKWLAANAYKYGFILRYPKDKKPITQIIFEPWHYRFVGKEAAAEIYARGLCLEEYLDKAGRPKDSAPEDGAEASEEDGAVASGEDGAESASEESGS